MSDSSGSKETKPAKPLTPPEQNRENWETAVRFFRAIKNAALHPDRLWRQLATWTVASTFVLLGIGSGIGVLSMTPPLFLFAKLCFIGAAVILWIKSAHWLATSKAARAERMILAFLIFGVSGMVLVEAVRWINTNQFKGNAAPAPNQSVIYTRFLGNDGVSRGGQKNPMGVRKNFKLYYEEQGSEVEFEAHISVRYGDYRPRMEVYARDPLGMAAFRYAIEQYSQVKEALVKESGFQTLRTSHILTIYPDFIITDEQIQHLSSKAQEKGLLLQVVWLQENGKPDSHPNPYQP